VSGNAVFWALANFLAAAKVEKVIFYCLLNENGLFSSRKMMKY